MGKPNLNANVYLQVRHAKLSPFYIMPDYFNFLCVYFNCCVKYCFVIGVVRVVATTICSHNKFTVGEKVNIIK